MSRVELLSKQLELETDRRRRAQLAERIGTALIRAAQPKKRPVRAKPAREPLPKSKWRPLSELRSLLRGAA